MNFHVNVYQKLQTCSVFFAGDLYRKEVGDKADGVDEERDDQLEDRLLPDHGPPRDEVQQPETPCFAVCGLGNLRTHASHKCEAVPRRARI